MNFPKKMRTSGVMEKEIPYYVFDEEGSAEAENSNGEAYIDDDELKDLLLEYLGDDVSHDEIQKILDAASDEGLSEEEFDKLLDEFILKNKK
jgi:D-serine dehydratase